MGSDDGKSRHTTYLHKYDADSPGKGRRIDLHIEEVKEDEEDHEDKDSIYDKGGFSDFSNSNQLIINFE